MVIKSLHLCREVRIATTQHQNLLVRSGTSTPDERLQLPPLAIPFKSSLLAFLEEAIPELYRPKFFEVVGYEPCKSHIDYGWHSAAAAPLGTELSRNWRSRTTLRG